MDNNDKELFLLSVISGFLGSLGFILGKSIENAQKQQRQNMEDVKARFEYEQQNNDEMTPRSCRLCLWLEIWWTVFMAWNTMVGVYACKKRIAIYKNDDNDNASPKYSKTLGHMIGNNFKQFVSVFCLTKL